jgi:hypothetical protein
MLRRSSTPLRRSFEMWPTDSLSRRDSPFPSGGQRDGSAST